MKRGGDRRPALRQYPPGAEYQPEKRAEQPAVDANPIQMRARFRFYLNPDLVVRQSREILAHHQRDLPAARFDCPAYQVIDQSLRKLIRVAVGIVKLSAELVDRAFDR